MLMPPGLVASRCLPASAPGARGHERHEAVTTCRICPIPDRAGKGLNLR